MDDPDRRGHSRWYFAALGFLLLLIATPSLLDDATRDVRVQCSRNAGHGTCTIHMGWLLHSYDWEVKSVELLGATKDCNDNGCWGTLDLVAGSEDLGSVDDDTFGEFKGEISDFIHDSMRSELDARLGPPRLALMMLAGAWLVCLGLIATYETTEIIIDRERRQVRLATRGLLNWADQDVPFAEIQRVTVQHMPTRMDRDHEPPALVWLERTGQQPLRVAKASVPAAEALAAWLRERLRARP